MFFSSRVQKSNLDLSTSRRNFSSSAGVSLSFNFICFGFPASPLPMAYQTHISKAIRPYIMTVGTCFDDCFLSTSVVYTLGELPNPF